MAAAAVLGYAAAAPRPRTVRDTRLHALCRCVTRALRATRPLDEWIAQLWSGRKQFLTLRESDREQAIVLGMRSTGGEIHSHIRPLWARGFGGSSWANPLVTFSEAIRQH